MTSGRRWLVQSIALGLLPVLAACGADGGPNAPTPAPIADSATVEQFSGLSLSAMQVVLHQVYGGQHFATPDPFLLPALAPGLSAARGLALPLDRLMARVSTVCKPVVAGVDSLGLAIDSDGDGTPDDFTADYGAGCVEPADGVEYTFSGKYRLRDTGNGLFDVEYTTTDLAAMVRDTATGDFIFQRVSGSESTHLSATHGVNQVDVVREVQVRVGADSGHVTLRTLAQSTFDPDGGSHFEAHGSLPQGSFGLQGELTFHDLQQGSDSVRFTLASTTPVHLAFACGTGIDGGALRGLLEGDARVGFRVSWGSCDQPAFEIFGTTE